MEIPIQRTIQAAHEPMYDGAGGVEAVIAPYTPGNTNAPSTNV
jgi:hypothetical protein